MFYISQEQDNSFKLHQGKFRLEITKSQGELDTIELKNDCLADSYLMFFKTLLKQTSVRTALGILT